jgi:type I restriction enzyme S subunit
MNADRLLALYEKVAEAPDAVPRLRRFVLDLAVRGKLVAQEAGDEPASELLKRIAAEKARLVKAGEIRKPKELPPVDDEPFDLASNWRWVRIRDVTSDRGQRIPDGDFTYIDVTAINKEAGIVAEPKAMTKDEAPSRARKIAAKGDVLYSCVRPYLLNVAVLDQDFDPAPIASTAFAVLNGHGLVLPRYLWIALRSPFMVECVEENQRGQAYPAINDADFAVLPFPLPPLAEQRRIVAKVEELMALCDRLAAARAARERVRDRLAAANLARLTAPDPETFHAAARFALEALAPLTTRPDQIKPLRQTILNLAVRGKLVEQDANDEPASELLKRIAAEKVQNGRRQKPLPDFEPDELGDVPTNWIAVPLIALGHWAIGAGFPKNEQGQSEGQQFFLKVSDMNLPGNEKYITTANHCIDEAAAKRMRAAIHPPGTIIFPKIGGAIATNKRRILTRGSAIDNNCLGITFSRHINMEWAFLLLTNLDFTRYQAGTAVPALQQGTLESIPIPLPPLAEQHRIVAKVDALMALCDRLEASLAHAAATRRRLLDALLAEALDPAAQTRQAAE